MSDEQIPLFNVAAYYPPDPEWLGSVTKTQRRIARSGLHPTGRALHANAILQCSGCIHAYRTGRYAKCKRDRERWTKSRGTDIRLRWRACVRHEIATPDP